MSYKFAKLLQFYLMTMRRTVGDDALFFKKSTFFPRNNELVFVFVFLLIYFPGLLTWHTSYSTNQLKLKAMPFLV